MVDWTTVKPIIAARSEVCVVTSVHTVSNCGARDRDFHRSGKDQEY
jgi:hypothetical protein